MMHLTNDELNNLAELTFNNQPYNKAELTQMEHLKTCEECYKKFCAALAVTDLTSEAGYNRMLRHRKKSTEILKEYLKRAENKTAEGEKMKDDRPEYSPEEKIEYSYNRQDEPDPDEDVFVVDYPQERVVWIYYNPDGNEARGQFVFNYVDFDIIREAAAQGITDSSKFFDYLLDNCQVKVFDRGTEAFPAAEEAFCNPKSIKSKGCTEATKNLLVKVAFDEERKRERERLPGNPRHAEHEAR